MTHHLAVALFFFFGGRSLYDALLAWDGGAGAGELAEVEGRAGYHFSPNDDASHGPCKPVSYTREWLQPWAGVWRQDTNR